MAPEIERQALTLRPEPIEPPPYFAPREPAADQQQEASGEAEDVAAPQAHIHKTSDSDYREGIYEIKVPAYSAVNYEVAMQEGDSIVYYWKARVPEPDLLSAQFHGYRKGAEGETGKVVFYHSHNSGEESGTLMAPFSGHHGWYLHNESAEEIVVLLRVAGFYSVIERQSPSE